MNVTVRAMHRLEILLTKRGEIFGGPGGLDLFNDASTASLTFQETISSISGSYAFDNQSECQVFLFLESS